MYPGAHAVRGLKQMVAMAKSFRVQCDAVPESNANQ
jgi:hypothetical protein